jgi:predicted nuclease with TOPRIM domain
MAKTRTEKIDSLQTEIAQLESKRKHLIQEQKTQERKDRTKRLCRRMGLFESLLPDTITLTDEHFKSFLEKTVLSESASKLLSALTAQNAAAAAPIRASAAAQSAPTPAAKPAETEQDEDADEGEDGGNGARVNG